MNQTDRNLMKKLGNKEYREAYAFEHVSTGIPFQIRRIRKQRGWSQERMAKEAGKVQSWISAVENDDKASFTLQTLREIASAFDVALCVRFVSFSRFLRDFHDVSPEALEAECFEKDSFDGLSDEPSALATAQSTANEAGARGVQDTADTLAGSPTGYRAEIIGIAFESPLPPGEQIVGPRGEKHACA